MNLSPIFGLVCLAVTIWRAVIIPSPRPELLLEWRGLALVVGGTVGVGLLIYPFSQLAGLGKFILYGVVFKRSAAKSKIAKEILSAAALAADESELYPMCPSSHPFLTESYQLLAEEILSEDDLREVLNRRNQYFKSRYSNDAKMLSTLGKFPSSLGMLGSTVGLVDMMAGLSRLGQGGIGEAMAMALATTFWGLIVTYLVLMPLADYALRLNAEDSYLRLMIVEGALMLKRREDPRVIADKLNSFLPINERITLRKSALPQDYWRQAKAQADGLRRNR
jgi:chemotaxis protein MotA